MHRRTLLSILGAGLVAGCAETEPGEPPATPSTPSPTSMPTATPTPGTTTTPAPAGSGPTLGVSLSPRSFQPDDFTAFFEQAVEAGSLVRWAGDWADLADPEGAATIVATLADRYDYRPVIATGVFSADRKELFRPLDEATQEKFVRTVVEFVAEFEPPYLELGVEVNSHWEADPESFETYVELFQRVADEIAARSLDTQLLVVFQLERLKGLQGGLFGGENDPSLAQWDLLDRFPAADLIGFTTYPGLIYRNPADVPADYYSALADRIDRPLAITETAWSAGTVAAGWESDEREQAAFVDRLFALTDDVELAFALWAFVYEQGAGPASFREMGLRRADGSGRPAWDAWVDHTR